MMKNEIPDIKVLRSWSRMRVRMMCIDHEFYTRGDNEEYEAMLSFVDDSYPDTDNLWLVALNIRDHSRDDCPPVTGIMYLLEKETVDTFYSLPEEE